MAYSKIQKILFALLCLFIIVFPFWCVRGLCADESEVISPIILTGTNISFNSNTFAEQSAYTTYVVELDNNYTYNIDFTGLQSGRIGYSNSYSIGSSVYNLTTISNTDFSLNLDDSTYQYLYICVASAGSDVSYNITRTAKTGMDRTINSLIDNVGINAIWNIFDISVNYIIIVVLFAFGVYIIFRIIKSISKGREGL